MFDVKQMAGNIYILKPNFDIDIDNIAKISELRNFIFSLLEKLPNLVLILDLEDCVVIDSLGLGNIIRIFEKMRKHKSYLFVLNANQNIEEAFKITTISNIVPLIQHLGELKLYLNQ